MNGTPQKSAANIMGRSCITIEETLELFPEAKAWVKPEEYQMIPFTPSTIYHLSKRKWEYILFPAFPCRLPNRFLSVAMIENLFQSRFPEVMVSTIRTEPIVNVWSDAPATTTHKKLYYLSPRALDLRLSPGLTTNYAPLYYLAAYSLNLGLQMRMQKWYLMTSQSLALGHPSTHKLWGDAPNKIERAVIYLYAWLLYWRLRERSIFNGKPFQTNDYYAPHKSKNGMALQFGDAEIMIGQVDNRTRPKMGIVRSFPCLENQK